MTEPNADAPVSQLVRETLHRLGVDSTIKVTADDQWTVHIEGKKDSADVVLTTKGDDLASTVEVALKRVHDVAGW